jgi:hypothetical protein
MRPKSILALLPFVTIHPAYGFVEQKIDEKVPLEVSFSRQFHNRISVADGSVRKLVGDPGLFSVTIDETIGQAFVNVLQDISETPACLTVVTSSGRVQDILVLSAEKHSEHLTLKDEEIEEEVASPLMEFHTHTIEFLNEILAGRVPLGYGKREVQTGDGLELPAPLEAVPVRVLEGPFEKIAVYRITNRGRKPIALKTASLKKPGDHWVFVDVNELDFTEEALCIVSSSKE